MRSLPRRLALFFAVLAFTTTACADAPPADTESAEAEPAEAAPEMAMVDGDCGDVHGTDVCSWAKLEGERVAEFGINVPLASIADADPEAPFVWPPALGAAVAMPDVVQEQLGVHDVTVYWESHGHPPGPYLIPHFDFHFYIVPAAEVAAIDCADETKPDAPPAGYALPDIEIPEIGNLVGLCVPAMGMHALLESEMASEESFTGTMVIGYYAGNPIFFEPMIPQDRLMLEESFSLDMPEVAGTGPGVVLPTEFEAVYDESTLSYTFVFSGLPTA
jgi:hypothetical protein